MAAVDVTGALRALREAYRTNEEAVPQAARAACAHVVDMRPETLPSMTAIGLACHVLISVVRTALNRKRLHARETRRVLLVEIPDLTIIVEYVDASVRNEKGQTLRDELKNLYQWTGPRRWLRAFGDAIDPPHTASKSTNIRAPEVRSTWADVRSAEANLVDIATIQLPKSSLGISMVVEFITEGPATVALDEFNPLREITYTHVPWLMYMIDVLADDAAALDAANAAIYTELATNMATRFGNGEYTEPTTRKQNTLRDYFALVDDRVFPALVGRLEHYVLEEVAGGENGFHVYTRLYTKPRERHRITEFLDAALRGLLGVGGDESFFYYGKHIFRAAGLLLLNRRTLMNPDIAVAYMAFSRAELPDTPREWWDYEAILREVRGWLASREPEDKQMGQLVVGWIAWRKGLPGEPVRTHGNHILQCVLGADTADIGDTGLYDRLLEYGPR